MLLTHNIYMTNATFIGRNDTIVLIGMQQCKLVALHLKHGLRWFTSKQPKHGEPSFSQISDSTTGYIFTPCVGSFSFPGIDTI